MPRLTLSERIMSFALTVLLVSGLTNPLAAQPFVGCPSKEILAAFNDFASVGKPPTVAWRTWVRDPKAQYAEPWKAFDNVHYVGVCWVSAWANVRSRFLRLPFGDQGIFCRREAYQSAGGFRDMAVCDDLDLVRRLRRTGRFVVRPELVTASARRYRDRGVLRQVLRVWVVLGGYFLGVSSERLGRVYYGGLPKPRRKPETKECDGVTDS
jgi:hypothetical protein